MRVENSIFRISLFYVLFLFSAVGYAESSCKDERISLIDSLIRSKPDTAKILILSDLQKMVVERDIYKIGCYQLLSGELTYLGGQHVEAGHLYASALEIFHQVSAYTDIGICHNRIGELYVATENVDLGLYHYHHALNLFRNSRDTSNIAETLLNMGTAYLHQGNIEFGKNCYFNALKAYTTLGNEFSQGAVLLMISYVELTESQTKKALNHALESLHIAEENNALANEIGAYYCIALIYKSQEKYDSAFYHFKSAQTLNLEFQNPYIEIDILTELSKSYEELDSTEMALRMLRRSYWLRDSLQMIGDSDQLPEFKFNVIPEGQIKNKISKSYYQYMIIVTCSILLAFFLRILKKNKSVKENPESQKKPDLVETLKHIENNDLIQYLKKEIKVLLDDTGMSEKNKTKLLDIQRQLKMKQSQINWGEFEVIFNQIHPDFYKKLAKAYPNLTNNDRILCSLIVINFNTADISRITKRSERSIEVAKYRLSKKIGIKDGKNLYNHLIKLT